MLLTSLFVATRIELSLMSFGLTGPCVRLLCSYATSISKFLEAISLLRCSYSTCSWKGSAIKHYIAFFSRAAAGLGSLLCCSALHTRADVSRRQGKKKKNMSRRRRQLRVTETDTSNCV